MPLQRRDGVGVGVPTCGAGDEVATCPGFGAAPPQLIPRMTKDSSSPRPIMSPRVARPIASRKTVRTIHAAPSCQTALRGWDPCASLPARKPNHMETSAQDKVLTDLRRGLPQTAALLSCRRALADELVRVWEHGATDSYTKHPLLSLLWSQPTTPRAALLDGAVAAIAPLLSPRTVQDLARRITGGRDFREASAALTELLVAGLFAKAGASVSFVPRAQSRTNDLTASRGSATVHIEVASLNISDDNERSERDVQQAFAAWPASLREVPADLQGRARQHLDVGGGFVRFCEYDVHPLGAGSDAEKIRNLARKKSDAQLRGLGQDRMLVNSFWHEFGVPRQLALPTFDGSPGMHTGHVYAATYGVPGDPILTGFRFDDEDVPTEEILTPGILPRSNVLGAVAWIFHSGAPVVFERLVGAPHLTDDARALVRDALVDPADGFSMLR